MVFSEKQIPAITVVILGIFLASFSVWQVASAEMIETVLPEPAESRITDDEIDNFLFRVSEDVRSKVLELDCDPVEQFPIPILLNVSQGDFEDTWGDGRGNSRVHLGSDIIAPLGSLVVSPTDAVVTKIGYDRTGGNFVITANPGGEQFYFAHLDGAAEGLSTGDVLEPGDLIGYVGNTGNARNRLPHLHLGVYYKRFAQNPFPRLASEFTLEEKITSLEKILSTYQIVVGANNGGVRFLQNFLIDENVGPSAVALAKTGATGYFGPLTKKALAGYQQVVGVNPASGHFGQITKTNILAQLSPGGTYVSAGQVAGAVATEKDAFEEASTEENISYSLVLQIEKDLEIGSSCQEVLWLQSFLMEANSGPNAQALTKAGATGYFGPLTKKALAEYQLAMNIKPSSGYFGSITRALLKALGGN